MNINNIGLVLIMLLDGYSWGEYIWDQKFNLKKKILSHLKVNVHWVHFSYWWMGARLKFIVLNAIGCGTSRM